MTRVWLVSLLVGAGVGVLYALLGVKSPAPPLAALFGLLGMVAGEHGTAWVQERLVGPESAASSTGSAARGIDNKERSE